MMTPAFNNLLCFNFMRCTKKVSKLINRPVVSLFDTRVSGTGTEMIAQCVYPNTRAELSIIHPGMTKDSQFQEI
jgi:hypothetical protein